MSVWDAFAEANSELSSIVSEASSMLRSDRVVVPMSDGSASYLEDVGLPGEVANFDSPPGGVYGSGVWRAFAEWRPVVFVMPALSPRGPEPIAQSDVDRLFRQYYGLELPDALYAVPLPPPTLYGMARTGEPIVVGIRNGMASAPIDREDEQGFLTAGHVAPTPGANVRTKDGQRLGIVRFSSNPLDHPAGQPMADVAFVSMSSVFGRSALWPLAHASVFGTARAGDSVEFHGQQGQLATWTRGLMPDFLYSQTAAGWGDVAITAHAVAREGDSGGAVTDKDGAIVGHIVAGAAGGYDIFQGIEYQLKWLETQ